MINIFYDQWKALISYIKSTHGSSKNKEYSLIDEKLFRKEIEETFDKFLIDCDYELINTTRNKFIYLSSNRRIEIYNQSMHTDYGFSFFIHNLKNEKSLLLINIPWEDQDKKQEYIRGVFYCFLTTPMILKTILGMVWPNGSIKVNFKDLWLRKFIVPKKLN